MYDWKKSKRIIKFFSAINGRHMILYRFVFKTHNKFIKSESMKCNFYRGLFNGIFVPYSKHD